LYSFEVVAVIKRAHAAILRGKSVRVNSAFTLFRCDRPRSSAVEFDSSPRPSSLKNDFPLTTLIRLRHLFPYDGRKASPALVSEESRPTFTNFIGNGHGHWLTRRVPQPKHNVAIAGSLLFVAFLWGGNNAGTKWLVASWPSWQSSKVWGTKNVRRARFEPSPDHRV
jgi:hypothetical protein